MAFFLWFKDKKNKPALLAATITMATLVFDLAVMPGSGGATAGFEQSKQAISAPALTTKNHQIADNRPAGVTQVSRGTSVNREDILLLARVIEGEAADEPYIGKVAVGAVIINRTRNKDFPHSIRDVIYQPDAFEAVTNGQYLRPLSPESIAAAREAVNGHDPTGGALYYWNPAKASSTWVWSRTIITRIGNHLFAR